jgi:hypothetical protein
MYRVTQRGNVTKNKNKTQKIKIHQGNIIKDIDDKYIRVKNVKRILKV